MGLREVLNVVDELKGRFDSPFGSADKNTIETLYYEVLGKTFVPTSCQRCYHDALIEISCYLKRHGEMAKKSNFALKAGAIIHSLLFEGGKVYTNDNLTDEVAKAYLKKFPGQIVLFSKVPEGFVPGQDEKPTLEEAQAMLAKAQNGLKSVEGRLVSAKKKVEEAKDEESKNKALEAVGKAEKSVEKATKNVEECEALVKSLEAEQDETGGEGGEEE